MDERIRNYTTPTHNKTFENLCLRYPNLQSGDGSFENCLVYGVFGPILEYLSKLGITEYNDQLIQFAVTEMLKERFVRKSYSF